MKKFENKKTLLSVLIIFTVGLALGIMFIFIINSNDKIIITNQITKYINLINVSTSYFKGFLKSFKNNFIYVTFIWSIGLIPFIFIINYFIIFYKGFLTGFFISSIIMIYKLKGIFLSLVFLFPHEYINMFLLITLSVIALKFSKKVYLKLKRNSSYDFNVIYKEYIKIYFIFIIFSLISSLLEVFFNSLLIRLVV
jgi:stage II sporulation protein M